MRGKTYVTINLVLNSSNWDSYYTQFYVFPIFSSCNSNFFTRITKPHILHFIDSYLRVYVVALIHFMSRS